MDRRKFLQTTIGTTSVASLIPVSLSGGTQDTYQNTSSQGLNLISFANEHGLGQPRLYRSVKEMIPHVDVIALFGKHYKRTDVLEEIVDAVKAGAELKGIVCEKPFARNMPEARRMIELVEQAGVPHAYFENQCHMKSINIQLTQLASVMDEMGPLTLVDVQESRERAVGQDAVHVFVDVRQTGNANVFGRHRRRLCLGNEHAVGPVADFHRGCRRHECGRQ